MASWCVPTPPLSLPRRTRPSPLKLSPLPLQGIDAAGSLTTPKVLEALLGTRLRGRTFGRTPLISGSRNSVALSADGDVFSWGWNARGTLGHGHRDPVPKPRRVAGLRGVPIVQVALGGWHTLYLDEQGQVYASGGDEYNQCGQGAQARDVLVPTLCLPTLRVCQVSAGGMHSLALTEDGQIWQWGEPWGAFSMTIDRTPRRIRPEPEPEGGTDGAAAADAAADVCFVAIACGAFHNLALTDDGRLYSWGLNDYGQLGLGHTASVTDPCRIVEGLEGVTVADISCGGWHSGLLTTAGECLMFGRGEYGRLGLGDKAGSSRLRPTKIWALEGTRVVS
jgi:alpha-tubulin suppressor-like RCC1 family protein